MRLLFSSSITSTLLLLFIASALLILLTMQTVESYQHHEQYHRSMRMGAYHDADVNDPFVVRAVEFTKESLALQSPYSGILLDDTPNLTLQVASAEIQVVAGMNIRLTLQVMDGDECTKTFDVEIYDHFGDMTVTKWGQERTCEKPNDAAVKSAPLMFEGTTVLENEAIKKDNNINTEDDVADSNDNAEEANNEAEEPNDDTEEVNDDAGDVDDDTEEVNDDAGAVDDDTEEVNDDAGAVDDNAEEGNDDAGEVDDDTVEANGDAEEPNEELVLGDDVSADTDDGEVEENN